MSDHDLSGSAGRMRVPRSRGAVSGIALIVLGLWGGLAPFIGPYFDFAFTPQPDNAWHWTAARGWFEVLPGGVALAGGLLLLFSANRAMTLLGAWIAVTAGGWFVVGLQVAPLLTLGSPGAPASMNIRTATAESLAFFGALGAVIVLFGALAVGRLSVRSVRDVQVAVRRDAEAREAEVVDAPVADAPVVDAPPVDEPVSEAPVSEAPVSEGPVSEAPVAEAPVAEASVAQAPVATSEHADAPYAPGGHTPELDEPPADATPQRGGPAYATPQRYVRTEPSRQIPVEQIRRDHPT